jgi:hypothetical protein
MKVVTTGPVENNVKLFLLSYLRRFKKPYYLSPLHVGEPSLIKHLKAS